MMPWCFSNAHKKYGVSTYRWTEKNVGSRGWNNVVKMWDYEAEIMWNLSHMYTVTFYYKINVFTFSIPYLLLIISQPGKCLYTTVRELVENALDSAESISELPIIEISMYVYLSVRSGLDIWCSWCSIDWLIQWRDWKKQVQFHDWSCWPWTCWCSPIWWFWDGQGSWGAFSFTLVPY